MTLKKKKPSAVPLEALAAVNADPRLRELALYTVDHAIDPRFNDLHKKHAYYTGKAYDNRPFDWTGKPRRMGNQDGSLAIGYDAARFYGGDSKAPVDKRKPNTQYALGRIIPNRFAAMLFGEHVFPNIIIGKDKSTEQWCQGIIKKAQLQMHMYHAAVLGGSMGSVITTFKVVNGRFRIENLNTKWINIEWKDYYANEMYAFCICQPLMKTIYNSEKKLYETKPFLYRRLVTEQYDIEFELQEGKFVFCGTGVGVRPARPEELPKVNAARTYQHGLGFVPAKFIQHLPAPDQIDGESACETVYDLIDRVNEGWSAVHAAIQANLDPTLVVKVTPEDYKKLLSMGGLVHTGEEGAGIVVGDKGDAKFIEIQCEGIKVAVEILEKLRTYALELCDCVIADPHKLTGAAQSAQAIEMLYGPMLAKIGILRAQYGEQAFKSLLVKMIKAYHIMIDTIMNEDSSRLEKGEFAPIEVTDPDSGQQKNVTPDLSVEEDHIDLTWGAYFSPTTADFFQAAEAIAMATGNKPSVSLERAVKTMAPYVGDKAPEKTIKLLEKQIADDQAREDKMNAAKAMPKPPAVKVKKTISNK